MIIFEPYKKYAVFSGRARRLEFWLFNLFCVIVCGILLTIDAIVGVLDSDEMVGLFSSLFILFSLIPYISVTVRRLHDTNRRGWWYLFSLIPLIGQIWLLVLCCLDSDPEENRFGKNPKEL